MGKFDFLEFCNMHVRQFEAFSHHSTHSFCETVLLIAKHELKLLRIHVMYNSWNGSTYYRHIKWNRAHFCEICHKIWHLTVSIIRKGYCDCFATIKSFCTVYYIFTRIHVPLMLFQQQRPPNIGSSVSSFRSHELRTSWNMYTCTFSIHIAIQIYVNKEWWRQYLLYNRLDKMKPESVLMLIGFSSIKLKYSVKLKYLSKFFIFFNQLTYIFQLIYTWMGQFPLEFLKI